MTFASLPQADRDRFEAWKGEVVKDCAWEQAFPSLAEQFPSPSGDGYVPVNLVDQRALLAGNAGSPLVAGSDGQLVMFGPPPHEIGFRSDVRSQRSTVNGRARVFEISANWQDGLCVVTLDGEELYRAAMPSTLPVILASDREALVGAGTDLSPLREAAPTGREPVAAVDSGPLLQHVLNALIPRRPYGFLASRFERTEALVQKLFPLGATARPGVVRLVSGAASPFPPSALLYGPRDALRSLYDGGSVQIELLYRGFHADLIAIHADLSIAAGGKAVRATAITAAAPVALSDRAATDCFVARGLAADFEPVQPRSPAFSTQFAGCEILAADGFAALAGDPSIRQRIAAVALSPGRTGAGTYRGWDTALIEVAQRLDAQGVSLTMLDPSSPVLPGLIERESTLRTAITDAATRAAFGGSLIALVFRWFFDVTAPTQAAFLDIASALANTASAYPESTHTMLAELAESTAATDPGMQAVQCGLGVTGAYRTSVDHMLAAAAEVPFSDSFADEQRARILQNCPTSTQLAELEVSIAAVRAFVAEDQARAAGSVTFELSIEPLVIHALEQRWTGATFGAVADLLGFAVISDFVVCAARPSLAQQLDCVDQPHNVFSTAQGRHLAPGAMSRNATLARELTARWPGLADIRYLTSRFDIQEAFFRGLWQGCADAGFDRSKARLFTLLDALSRATTIDERFDLQDEITALVNASTCP